MRKTLMFQLICGVLFASITLLLADESRTAKQNQLTKELNVFAAASLSDVLKEISENYAKETGERLVFNFAASSTLERQIEEGAPADVFFSADEEKMDKLENKGLLLPGTRHSLLSNTLVIVVSIDSSLRVNSAFDLTNAAISQVAIGEPSSVPAGIYARQCLTQFGLWQKLKGKCVPTENVRAALAAVESGNADAGIVYKTDARISKGVRVAYEVPVANGPRISYPIAVIRDSREAEAAKRLVRYLGSDGALQVFRKYGFLVDARSH
ncbi:MAG TPA: molybdate ABC transporter substrate-binding protein [Verrucomicrobiae bacterium]|nr:molybdate ABC transporter substrate-binding protein [Verrucomicrobiae bacterium]